MSKFLAIIMSYDTEKIQLGLMFYQNMKMAGHSVRVAFFGPSERALAEDQELKKMVEALQEKPKACVLCAKQYSIENKINELADLILVGNYIAESVEQGYIIITF
ncbi:MAG: hypothetical protein ARM1_0806 [Candidatus Micrarchaeota archaeon]|nr:MAG: hypothetical protein ARM1_0806 [Candidatus Micrarchaeota archaeon]